MRGYRENVSLSFLMLIGLRELLRHALGGDDAFWWSNPKANWCLAAYPVSKPNLEAKTTAKYLVGVGTLGAKSDVGYFASTFFLFSNKGGETKLSRKKKKRMHSCQPIRLMGLGIPH